VAVFLIPARTDTRWFHDIVLPNAKEIRFIRGRLHFGGSKNAAPFPSMIVIFEKRFQDAAGVLRREQRVLDTSVTQPLQSMARTTSTKPWLRAGG
jgi:hypothetical protein